MGLFSEEDHHKNQMKGLEAERKRLAAQQKAAEDAARRAAEKLRKTEAAFATGHKVNQNDMLRIDQIRAEAKQAAAAAKEAARLAKRAQAIEDRVRKAHK